jgi:hypothetical protein
MSLIVEDVDTVRVVLLRFPDQRNLKIFLVHPINDHLELKAVFELIN